MLPCQHVYCTECLQKLMHRDVIYCPACRREHIVPNGDVGQFPANLTLTQLADLADQQEPHQDTAKVQQRNDLALLVLRNLEQMTQGHFRPIRELVNKAIVDDSQQVESLKRKVRDDFSLLVNTLSHRMQNILDDISSKEEKQVKKLNKICKRLQNTEASVSAFCTQEQRRLKTCDSTGVETIDYNVLFDQINEYTEKVRKLTQQNSVITTTRMNVDMKWRLEKETESIEDISKTMETFGQLRISEETRQVCSDVSDSCSETSSASSNPGEPYLSSGHLRPDVNRSYCAMSNDDVQEQDVQEQSNMRHTSSSAHVDKSSDDCLNQEISQPYIQDRNSSNRGNVAINAVGRNDEHFPTFSKGNPRHRHRSPLHLAPVDSDSCQQVVGKETDMPPILRQPGCQQDSLHPNSDEVKVQVQGQSEAKGTFRQNKKLVKKMGLKGKHGESTGIQYNAQTICEVGSKNKRNDPRKSPRIRGGNGSVSNSARERICASAPSPFSPALPSLATATISRPTTKHGNLHTSDPTYNFNTFSKNMNQSSDLSYYQRKDKQVFFKPGSQQIEYSTMVNLSATSSRENRLHNFPSHCKKTINKQAARVSAASEVVWGQSGQLEVSKCQKRSLNPLWAGKRISPVTDFGSRVLISPNSAFLINPSHVAIADRFDPDRFYNELKVFDINRQYKQLKSIQLPNSGEAKLSYTWDMCYLPKKQFALSDSGSKVVKIYEEKQQKYEEVKKS